MRYTRTLRTFPLLLLLLSAALTKEEQARHDQRLDEGLSQEQYAGAAEGTEEEATDEDGSCDASDCAELGTKNVNLEPDRLLKPSDPEAVFDTPGASRQDGLVTDPSGRTESEDLQLEDRPSPGETRLPTLKTTEPPTAPHEAETPADNDALEVEPEGVRRPADVTSTAPEDDEAVKPSAAASESRTEAPAVGEELQATQTDGPGALYPTPPSPEPQVPHQERTATVTKAEEDGPSRTEECEAELEEERSPSLDKPESPGPTQEPREKLETSESKVIIETSEPPSPADESTSQSHAREASATVAGVGTPTETPEAVAEPERPPQHTGEPLTPAPTGEPVAEESEAEESIPEPDNTADFESEQQPSLNDSDTPREVSARGGLEATRVPRRGSPLEPVRVGLPMPGDESEKGEGGEEDSELFEQMPPPTVAFIPELSPK